VLSNGASGARFRRLLWPAAPLGGVALGVAVLALPARMEGPPLVAISPGHALSLVDGVGVVPLVAGSLWLHVGLLLASAFSTFYWWWALGAAIFAVANGAAVVVAVSADQGPGA